MLIPRLEALTNIAATTTTASVNPFTAAASTGTTWSGHGIGGAGTGGGAGSTGGMASTGGSGCVPLLAPLREPKGHAAHLADQLIVMAQVGRPSLHIVSTRSCAIFPACSMHTCSWLMSGLCGAGRQVDRLLPEQWHRQLPEQSHMHCSWKALVCTMAPSLEVRSIGWASFGRSWAKWHAG